MPLRVGFHLCPWGTPAILPPSVRRVRSGSLECSNLVNQRSGFKQNLAGGSPRCGRSTPRYADSPKSLKFPRVKPRFPPDQATQSARGCHTVSPSQAPRSARAKPRVQPGTSRAFSLRQATYYFEASHAFRLRRSTGLHRIPTSRVTEPVHFQSKGKKSCDHSVPPATIR